MKRYIFLFNQPGSIGGGQIYLWQKTEWLSRHGWQVTVAYSRPSEIRIPEMKRFQPNHVPHLEYPFPSLTSPLLHKAFRLLHGIAAPAPDDEVVVESYIPQFALWGEWLAARWRRQGIDARHVCYLLTESPRIKNPAEHALLLQMAGEGRLRSIYSSNYRSLGLPEGLPLLPPHSDTCPHIRPTGWKLPPDAEHADFTILLTARFEKPFMATVFSAIGRWAASHTELRITILAAGQANSFTKHKLERELRCECGEGDECDEGDEGDEYGEYRAGRLSLLWVGAFFPMPVELYSASDILITNAVSTREGFAQGLETICIDADTHRPIGRYGRDTLSITYSDPMPVPLHSGSAGAKASTPRRLEDMLGERWEEVRGIREVPPLHPDYTPLPTEADFSDHLEWIETTQGVSPQEECAKFKASPYTKRERFFALALKAGLFKPLLWLKHIHQRFR